ncbi:hypothetical protein OG960_39710 [Streptomyces sp. NBC_00280]
MGALSHIRTGPEGKVQSALQSADRQNIRPASSRQQIADGLSADVALGSQRAQREVGALAQSGGEAAGNRLDHCGGRLPDDPGVRPLVRVDGVTPWRRRARSASGHKDALLQIVIDTDVSGRLTGHMSWALRLEVAVSNRLLAYAPKPETVPPAKWRRIAPVVRSLGFLTVAAGPYGPDVIMTPLARLVAWVEAQGLPLEPSVILDQSTVERFILVGCPDMAANSRRTCSSQLRRASEALLLDQLGQHPPIRLKATATPVAPYPQAEVARWLIWAQSLPTPAQRRNAGLLFCLGIGCGLAVEDVVYVQGRDIHPGPTGRALVKVHGRRPRTVVCRSAYEELLLAEAADIPADAYAFRPGWQERTSKHIASDWLAKYPRIIGRCDGAVLQTQRLRTTWIVDLLNARIPLNVILKASGLTTLHSLSRYLVFLHDVPEVDASDLLRGAAA